MADKIKGTRDELKPYLTDKGYKGLVNDHHPDDYIYTLEPFGNNKCMIY